MPGTVLGIYAVAGTLATNTCGRGLAPPSPWDFNVELSRDTTTLYWNTMDGSPLLSGAIASSGVDINSTTNGVVDATADGGPGPCTMARADALALTIDAVGAAVPKTFSGTLTYTFSAVPGSDCSDQLSAAGGTYDALPCTVSYALSGTYARAGD